METVVKRKPGQHITHEERTKLVEDLAELLTLGFASTNAIAKKLEVDNTTIDKYLPMARGVLQKLTPDKDTYRSEHIARLRRLCQMVVDDLERVGIDGKAYERAALYRVLGTFMGQLALVTGLNVETQVHVDTKPLVIIRNPAEQQLEAKSTGQVVLRETKPTEGQRSQVPDYNGDRQTPDHQE